MFVSLLSSPSIQVRIDRSKTNDDELVLSLAFEVQFLTNCAQVIWNGVMVVGSGTTLLV